MAAYIVFFREKVHNPEAMKEYGAKARRITGHPIPPLALYGKQEVVEASALEGVAILTFPRGIFTLSVETGGMEEFGALGGKEAVEHAADALDQSVDSSCGLVPQQRLELCEGHLDRVHIGAVGRQVEELGSTVGDRLADAGHLVGGQVIEHHNVAAL